MKERRAVSELFMFIHLILDMDGEIENRLSYQQL